jgi:hypothetical protein
MIISRGRAYVFVHIPKTGGTSVALALEARAMKDDMMLGDTPKAKKRRRRLKDANTKGRLWKHSTLSDIDGLVSVPDISEMFTFALVRNPWDRAVSYYTWLRAQKFDHPAVHMARAMSFDAFVADGRTLESFRATPARHYMTCADGVERCNSYIRLESFEQDAGPLVAHLGFPLHISVHNRSARQADYRRYYNDKTAGLLAQSCAEDIARFGYCFE